MKELITILIISFLLMGIPLASAFPEDIGTHAEGSVNDPNIEVREGSFLERLTNFLPFAIATQNQQGAYVGTFYPGESVNFRVDVTSYNVICRNSYVVAEVYNAQGKFVKSSSKWIGSISGGNNYFIADIPYSISSTETSFGTWNGAGYLWCDDTYGENIQKLISKSYSTSFNVAQKGTACMEGYKGSNTCRSSLATSSGNNEDAYRLYVKADCNTEYRRVDQCSSTEICSAGSCVGNIVTPEEGCGNGICVGDETELNCSADCKGSTPTDDDNSNNDDSVNGGGSKSFFSSTLFWIVVALAILIFTGIGKKLLGFVGVKIR